MGEKFCAEGVGQNYLFAELSRNYPQKELPVLIKDPPPDLIKRVCGRCSLKETKPSAPPAHFATYLSEANHLLELKELGFPLPDLTHAHPRIIAAALGANRARNRSQSLGLKQRRRDAHNPSHKTPSESSYID